jgi:biotin carboxyl carrier protein
VNLAISAPDDLDTLVAMLKGATSPQQPEAHQGERLYVSERLVISPCAGIFQLAPGQAAPGQVSPEETVKGAGASTTAVPALPSGTPVEIGELVGLVSGTEVRSPFAGELMGVLAHPGERVQPGQPIAWLRAR